MRTSEVSKNGWQVFDAQTAVSGTDWKVAHRATAVENARAAAIDLFEVLPDKTLALPAAVMSLPDVSPFTVMASFLFGIVADVIEVVLCPLYFLKDLFDTLIHGVAGIFRKDEQPVFSGEPQRWLDTSLKATGLKED